ncbi:NIN-like protein, partial [Tanacetum coccineum]
DVFTLNLPIPLATLAVVKKEINKRCKLNPETYKLKYLDEDEDWILMTSEEPIMHCIECQRTQPPDLAHLNPFKEEQKELPCGKSQYLFVSSNID